MVNPSGISDLAGKIAEQGLKESANPQQDVHAHDQARLQNALRDPLPKDPVAQESPPPLAASAEVPVRQIQSAQPNTLGDSILQGMDKMRQQAQEVTNQLSTVDRLDSITPMEALHAQLQISRVMFNEQLTGQVTGKVEQDMDTLMKSQ